MLYVIHHIRIGIIFLSKMIVLKILHCFSKRFSAQGNLQAHLKIHTGQRDHVGSIKTL